MIQVVALLAVVSAAVLYIPSHALNAGRTLPPFAFDEKQAYETALEFEKQCRDRQMGSPGARAAASWIAEQFKSAGMEAATGKFEAEIGSGRLEGVNVSGRLNGPEPAVWVLAHYTSGPAVDTDMDSASSIGVLIELGREVAKQNPRRQHRFIAADGATWGMLGARRLAQEATGAQLPPAVVLTLDCSAKQPTNAIAIDSSGYDGGYSPAWLRDLACRSLQSAGMRFTAGRGFNEHTQRALDLSFGAQGPFLAQKIAAIGLRGIDSSWLVRQSDLSLQANPLPQDPTLALTSCGRSAAALLAALEIMEVLPEDDSQFNLAGSLWVDPMWLKVVHWIWFLPLAMAAFTAWHSTRVRLAATSAEPEWFSLSSCVLPLLTAYGVLYLFLSMRWMSRYETTPAPTADESVISIQWIPLGFAFLGGLLVLALIRFIRHEREVPFEVNLLATRTAAIICLAALALASLLYNSYWAATFLLVPSLLWPLLPEGKRARYGELETRGGWIVILLGGLPLLGLLIAAALKVEIGGRWPWYVLLTSLTGMIQPPAVIMGIILIGVSYRLFLAYLSVRR